MKTNVPAAGVMSGLTSAFDVIARCEIPLYRLFFLSGSLRMLMLIYISSQLCFEVRVADAEMWRRMNFSCSYFSLC